MRTASLAADPLHQGFRLSQLRSLHQHSHNQGGRDGLRPAAGGRGQRGPLQQKALDARRQAAGGQSLGEETRRPSSLWQEEAGGWAALPLRLRSLTPGSSSPLGEA